MVIHDFYRLYSITGYYKIMGIIHLLCSISLLFMYLVAHKVEFANAGDLSSIPGSGRSPGEGNGNPLQYSCLENPWTEEPGRLQFIGSQRVRLD